MTSPKGLDLTDEQRAKLDDVTKPNTALESGERLHATPSAEIVSFYKTEGFEFYSESKRLVRYWYFINTRVVRLVDITSSLPPVRYKGDLSKGRDSRRPTLAELGRSLSFEDTLTQALLGTHKERMELRTAIYKVVNGLSFVVQIAFLLLVWSIVFPLAVSVVNNLTANFGFANEYATLYASMFMVLTLGALMLIFTNAVASSTSVIVDRYFAETLSLYTCVFLLLELWPPDALTEPSRRNAVLERINRLARNTLLLPSRYQTDDPDTQVWLRQYFKQMEQQIRELERRAIAPTKNTLEELRHEFRGFAAIYLTGHFGDFAPTKPAPALDIKPLTWRQVLFSQVPRFVGLVIPLLLLGYFLWHPEQLRPMNVEPNVIALLFVAWLLLAVDSTFKLGIVDKVTKLASDIKNLK